MNFARLTRNQRSIPRPNINEYRSAAFPAAIDTDMATPRHATPRSLERPEWFPVIQHRRARPQIICILSRRFERCNGGDGGGETCVRAISRYCSRSRCFVLVFRMYRYVEERGCGSSRMKRRRKRMRQERGEEQKCTDRLLNKARARLDTARGSCGRPHGDHAAGVTRSFRGLKNFTAGIIVMTRAASYTSRGFPRLRLRG